MSTASVTVYNIVIFPDIGDQSKYKHGRALQHLLTTENRQNRRKITISHANSVELDVREYQLRRWVA